eukprot:TRINITY_DN1537_c0_g1_i2.p1 TRINITY_DN1537_c0_g1~~TRINITY_DN1537_c0_g1_i2.p1  ORF type:complete len:891 (+),score=262.07 TRINITY_DN1537_c0_g1_i2:102-2774(+)
MVASGDSGEMSNEITQWLHQNGLRRLAPVIQLNEFETLDEVLKLGEKDLVDMEISEADRAEFLGAVEKERGAKEVASWLQSHGLGKHADAFRENEINSLEQVKELNADDVKEMVKALGPRKKILSAIQELVRADARSESPASTHSLKTAVPDTPEGSPDGDRKGLADEARGAAGAKQDTAKDSPKDPQAQDTDVERHLQVDMDEEREDWETPAGDCDDDASGSVTAVAVPGKGGHWDPCKGKYVGKGSMDGQRWADYKGWADRKGWKGGHGWGAWDISAGYWDADGAPTRGKGCPADGKGMTGWGKGWDAWAGKGGMDAPGQKGQQHREEAVAEDMSAKRRGTILPPGSHIAASATVDNPDIYQLPLRIKHEDRPNLISVYTVGHVNLRLAKPRRRMSILMVGATGAGKSTLIEFLVNRMMGIEWTDQFRFRMIPSSVTTGSKDQSMSQTDWITAYEVCCPEDCEYGVDFTIIDSPGFGDTRGPERDERLRKQLKAFFDSSWVPELSGVAFVCQASNARLTASQRFIFESVMGIFGKDIERSIYPCFTFADSKRCQALDALKAARIPFDKHFKFNNSALTTRPDTAEPFDRLFWDMGSGMANLFLREVCAANAVPLEQTRQVLKEREALECAVEGLGTRIKLGLQKMDTLKETCDAVRRNQAAVNDSKEFTVKVAVDHCEKEPLPDGCTTTCLTCQWTCHEKCVFADDKMKANCCAMRDGQCTSCPKKCHWKMHRNLPYKMVWRTKHELRTSAELKARYVDASSALTAAEQVCFGLLNEVEQLQDAVQRDIWTMRKARERLAEIALRPDSITAVEYFDLLIDAEKHDQQAGYQKRIGALRALKKRAELILQVTGDDYDPWKDYGNVSATLRIKKQGMSIKQRFSSLFSWS